MGIKTAVNEISKATEGPTTLKSPLLDAADAQPFQHDDHFESEFLCIDDSGQCDSFREYLIPVSCR